MFRAFIMIAFIFTVYGFSQTIHLTGKIVDSSSLKPVGNAKISIVSLPAISSVSNDSGIFILNNSVSINSGRILSAAKPGIILNGNTLKVSNAISGVPLIAEVFNSAGVRIYFAKKQTQSENATIFTSLWKTPGVYFLKLQIGTNCYFSKFVSGFNNSLSIFYANTNSAKALYKSAFAYVIDVTKSGYFSKQFLVTNPISDVGVIKLCPIIDSVNYIPLNIGNFIQFQLQDSSTLQVEVIGSKLRSDNKPMFIETMQTGNQIPDTSYFYDDGQFLVKGFSLDSLTDSSGYNISISQNPFGEQRLALKTPTNNQVWYQFKEDTTSLYRISKSYGTLATSIGSFQNVFGFELYDLKEDSLPWMTVCFANKIGWIATIWGNSIDSLLAMPVYLHVGGVEKGAMIPKRDPPLAKTAKISLVQKNILMSGSVYSTKSAYMRSRNRAP